MYTVHSTLYTVQVHWVYQTEDQKTKKTVFQDGNLDKYINIFTSGIIWLWTPEYSGGPGGSSLFDSWGTTTEANSSSTRRLDVFFRCFLISVFL